MCGRRFRAPRRDETTTSVVVQELSPESPFPRSNQKTPCFFGFSLKNRGFGENEWCRAKKLSGQNRLQLHNPHSGAHLTGFTQITLGFQVMRFFHKNWALLEVPCTSECAVLRWCQRMLKTKVGPQTCDLFSMMRYPSQTICNPRFKETGMPLLAFARSPKFINQLLLRAVSRSQARLFGAQPKQTVFLVMEFSVFLHNEFL